MLHLGITPSQQKLPGQSPKAANQGIGRFLLPLEHCEFALETAIDELQVCPFSSCWQRWFRIEQEAA